MAELDDLKMILRNADVSCITDAKTYTEQKIRFGECIIFVSSLERREAEIRNKAIDEFADMLHKEFHGEHWTQFCTIRNKVDEITEQLKGNEE